jgi:hypothetical protein
LYSHVWLLYCQLRLLHAHVGHSYCQLRLSSRHIARAIGHLKWRIGRRWRPGAHLERPNRLLRRPGGCVRLSAFGSCHDTPAARTPRPRPPSVSRHPQFRPFPVAFRA